MKQIVERKNTEDRECLKEEMVSSSKQVVLSSTILLIIGIVCILAVEIEAGVRKYQTKNSSHQSSVATQSRLVLTPIAASSEQRQKPLTANTTKTQQLNKSESYAKYRKNFVKLVENFLLKHIEKALKKKASLMGENDSSSSSSEDDDDVANIDSDYYSSMISEEVGPTWSRLMPKCNQTVNVNCKNSHNEKMAEWDQNISKLSSRFRKRINYGKKNKSSDEEDDDLKSIFRKNLLLSYRTNSNS